MTDYDKNTLETVCQDDISWKEKAYELCLICCSKVEISCVQNIELLPNCLTVFFVLRHLLKVPSSQLERNLKEFGSPDNWIKLCDQCTKLTSQAEQLYRKIVYDSRELRFIQKLIVNKIRKVSCNSEEDDDSKSNGKEIRTRIYNFVQNYGYIEQGGTKVNPFIEGDKLAKYLAKSTTDAEFDTEFYDSCHDDFLGSPAACVGDHDVDMDNDRDENSQEFELDARFVSTTTTTITKSTKPTNRSSKTQVTLAPRRPYKKMIKMNGKWKCRHCDKLFRSGRACNVHESKIHHSNPSDPYICDICGKSLNNPESLMVHRRNVHKIRLDGSQTIRKPLKPPPPRKKYPENCDICGKSFQDRIYLRNHIRYVHEKELEHKCEMCGLHAFGRRSDLKRHQLAVHKNNPKIKKLIEEGKGIWRCGVTGCRAQFFKKRNLEKHNEKFHKDSDASGRFACSFCGKGFWEMHNLKNHELVHKNLNDGINRFCCEVCGKSFPSPLYLTNHKRIHKKARK